MPSGPDESSASWPNGCTPDSCDPSRPRRVALTPPTSDATRPRPILPPTAPYCRCHSYVLQGWDDERKMHTGAPSRRRVSAEKGLRQPRHPMRRPRQLNWDSGSGTNRTGAETKRDFKVSKATCASGFHLKITLVEVNAVRGAAIWPKFLMYRR